MKKSLFFLLLIFFCIQNATFCSDEVNLEFNDNFQKLSYNLTKYKGDKAELQKPIENTELIAEIENNIQNTDNISTPLTLQSGILNSIKKTADSVYNLQVSNLEAVSPLLTEQMTAHFENGPIESLHTWAAFQNNFDIMMAEGNDNSYAKYDLNLVNVLFDAKSRSEQDAFRIMLSPTHQHARPFMQQLFQDVYYETKRIPHHSILIGNSRVGTGLEGVQSSYTLPFLNRAQISRNLSNIRKVGMRVRGNFKYADYDIGTYSSDTYFSEFIPGAEFNSWINLKPLADFSNKYGKLTAGSGFSAGKRHATDYFVYGAGLQYNYKRLWTRAEYALSDGSNGASGLTSKRRQGWYVTLGYRLTKKAEWLVRYDEFDPDKSIGGNNRREYTTGINYYLKGQALKFVLNYIYCQNESANNSHRILIGAQLAL